MFRWSLIILAFGLSTAAASHPLRLSLCEVEYTSNERLLTVNLKLFLTDVNEAIVFDPYSEELAFCQPNEPPRAERLLLEYLDRFFYIMVNGLCMDLEVKHKKLSGEGENTALWVYFEFPELASLKSLEIKNAVFTDLFFDQSNIVYVHVDGVSESLMLNKKTDIHELTY